MAIKVVGTDFGNIRTGWSATLMRAISLFTPFSVVRDLRPIHVAMNNPAIRAAAQAAGAALHGIKKSNHSFDHQFDEKFDTKGIFDLSRVTDWQLVHQYTSTNTRYQARYDLPAAKFSYDVSPLTLLIKKVPSSSYMFNSFWVSLCALIGGL